MANEHDNQNTQQQQKQANDIASNATDTARGLYDTAKSTVGQAYGAATKRATSALDEQKGTLAEGLTSVAESVRQVGENLNTGEQHNAVVDTAARYSDSIARQIENISGYFERKDVREMVRDVEMFARRNPAYFIGGAVALGFVAARFLKSSNPERRLGRGSTRLLDEGGESRDPITFNTPGQNRERGNMPAGSGSTRPAEGGSSNVADMSARRPTMPAGTKPEDKGVTTNEATTTTDQSPLDTTPKNSL